MVSSAFGFSSFVYAGRQRDDSKTFLSAATRVMSQWVMSGLGFAGNRLTKLLYRFTGFPARFAALLLKFPGDVFSFAFRFEFGILDQFPSLVLNCARNLFALTFDLIFVPHTC